MKITTLVIPRYNDSNDVFDFLIESLSKISLEIPWHISRFYPTYRMSDHYPTPVEKIRQLRTRAVEAGLKYVYTGNIFGDQGENTFCPNCGFLLVEREGYLVSQNNVVNGRCRKCKFEIAGVWK